MNLAATTNVVRLKGFWRFKMTPLLLVLVAATAPVAGIGLLHLQARLEQWDYQRHAED
jgi:hypothetical protein